jgi:putative resolvase
MKLSAYAKKLGVHYRTAYQYFVDGQISGAYQLTSGTIIVPDEILNKDMVKDEHNVVYARVSSSENKPNLDSQADRLILFCNANGWCVHEIVKECASGLNDKRPKLLKILSERRATRIIVEHKDRLTRFGFNYIDVLYPECDIVVVNPTLDDRHDLMQDFISLVTSFCARIYGLRRSKRKTKQIIESLNND